MQNLTVENVGKGHLLSDANRDINKAVEDCLARPMLKKARKVTVEIQITPEWDAQTETVTPLIECSSRIAMPAVMMKQYGVVENGLVQVAEVQSDQTPSAIRQGDLEEGELERKRKAVNNGE